MCLDIDRSDREKNVDKYMPLCRYITAQPDAVSLKPKNLSVTEAASIGIGFLTAYIALVNSANVQEGENVLVLGEHF